MSQLLVGVRSGAAWARCRTPLEVVGVAGALVAFVGLATMFALQTPPFLAPDETAHLGYATEIADGDLPEIDKEPSVPADATQWQAERASGADDRYRTVWVANHPPLHYVATAPLIWWSDVTDRPDGGLMLIRLANIAFAAAGVALTYLLATEVSGGARRVGLAAASLAAFVPQGHGLFSEGLNDGLGFAAGAAVTWAAARCLRRGCTRTNLLLLGGTAAVAAGARTSTMLLAVVVVGFVSVAQLVRRGSLGRRMGAAALTAAIGLGPSIVLFGWFYVRNILLYGDVGASSFLLERFNRTDKGRVLEIATWGHMWSNLYHMLLSPSPLFSVKAPPGTNPAIVVAAVGLAIALVLGRTGDRSSNNVRWAISRRSLLLGALAVAVIALTVAQHVSGGGNAYARYLFPVLPVIATGFAIGFDRLLPRVLPALSVGALGYWAWRNVPTSVDISTISRPRDRGRGMPDALRVIPSSATGRNTVMALAVVGSITLGVVLLVGLWRARSKLLRDRLSTRPDPRPGELSRSTLAPVPPP